MKVGGFRSIKLRRLARILEVPQYAAVGLLETLWFVVGSNTPRGDIGKLSDEEIASELGWERDADVLVTALVEAGWLDRDEGCRLVVHDWAQHAPEWVKKEWKRKDVVQTSSRRCPDNVETVSADNPVVCGKVEQGKVGEGRVEVGKAAPPVPRETIVRSAPDWDAQGFEAFYGAYPKKEKRELAVVEWDKLKPGPALQAELLAHVAARKKTHGWQKNGGEFVPLPETFLRDRRWTDEVKATGPSVSSVRPEPAGRVVPDAAATKRMLDEKFA